MHSVFTQHCVGLCRKAVSARPRCWCSFRWHQSWPAYTKKPTKTLQTFTLQQVHIAADLLSQTWRGSALVSWCGFSLCECLAPSLHSCPTPHSGPPPSGSGGLSQSPVWNWKLQGKIQWGRRCFRHFVNKSSHQRQWSIFSWRLDCHIQLTNM